jgi:hypothetical protein
MSAFLKRKLRRRKEKAPPSKVAEPELAFRLCEIKIEFNDPTDSEYVECLTSSTLSDRREQLEAIACAPAGAVSEDNREAAARDFVVEFSHL